MEYTRDLGYCAAKFLLGGGNAAWCRCRAATSCRSRSPTARSETGRARVRMVDIRSTRYAIARRYMIRLRRDDFEDPHELAKFAAAVGLTLQEFRAEFEYLIADEPPPLELSPAEEHEYPLLRGERGHDRAR
jgi:6-phosphofructokinase 1